MLATLRLLEPAVAFVTNRLGDVLAHTSGFELMMRGSGLLETQEPNLTRYVFTDPRARTFFADWDQVADEQAFDLWLGPSVESSEWFKSQLAPSPGRSSPGGSTATCPRHRSRSGSTTPWGTSCGGSGNGWSCRAPTRRNWSSSCPPTRRRSRPWSACAVGPAARFARSADVAG
ncbi:MmyB family transcriptional regulator [Thermocatellispora tengchongensis]|uniref:MmyB family transcriptional regulator n=1 Tax=Thermocatellispora tengchongensis TaxID=1073253 RepID=UPI00362C85FE